MARQQLMRKRKLGTVDSPFIHMTDTSRSGYEDSESKRLCTTALNGGKMPRTSEYVHWRVDQVVAYLSSNDFDAKVCAAFKDVSTGPIGVTTPCVTLPANQLRGSHILLVTEEMLDKMGIKAIGVQKDIIALFRALQQQDDRKVFNDPIHGHFELHPLLVQVIDTPQFQRLRNIKQLGGGYYVFPGASHNRFEHSLGVCHIAGEFVENLQRKQPELGITEVDVLCVKMAGLCHDLGHGPFSHLFDSLFIPRACPNSRRKWRHEDASVTMLDYLLEENELRPEFSRYGLQEQDIVFIKEIIAGPLLDKEKEDEGIEEEEEEVCLSSSEYPVSPDKREVWQYSGRTLEKSFLYEIVANKRNGVDVDKWDYFARDCHCLGIPNNFDMLRYMKFARVISVNGRRQICARDKEVNNLYEMFHTRDGLHRRAYQHKTSNVVELMITEALLEANDHLLLPGKDGRQVKMSEAIYDMTAYSRLTDGVLHQIMLSSNPELEKSKQLILQIEKRRLYKCVGQTQPSRDMTLSEVDIQHQLVESLTPSQLCSLPELTPDDFLVQVVKFDYGMRDKNPIDMMRFYVKGQPDRAVKVRKDQVSQMLPHTFQEKSVRVYCKKLDQDSNSAAWKYFIAWCNKQKQFVTPKGYISSSQEENNDDDDDEEDEAEEGDVVTPYGTPYGTPAKTIVESDGEHSKDGDKQPQLLIEEVKKKLFSQ